MVAPPTASKSISSIELPVQSNQYFVIIHHNIFNILLMNPGSLVLSEGRALQIG